MTASVLSTDTASSNIEQLARTLWLSRSESGLFGMLSAAFDASGSKLDQPVLVVAGFISSVGDWSDFDKEWRSRLAKDNVEYFHAYDFAHSIGPFDGWRRDEARRRALSHDLMDIVKSHVHEKFGSIVINDLHARGMSKEMREGFFLEAFPLAARTVVAKVAGYAASFSAKGRRNIN